MNGEVASEPGKAQGTRGQLQRQASEIDARLALLEAKIQVLSEPPKQGAWWIAPSMSAGGSLASAAVAIFGFWLVHRFSLLRQRRDEFFKRVDACIGLITETSRGACELWHLSGDSVSAQSLQLLQSRVDAVTNSLTLLTAAEPGLNVTKELVEFRELATLDIELPTRLADSNRADRVLRVGQTLSRRLLECYRKVFDVGAT